jgi:DNA primase
MQLYPFIFCFDYESPGDSAADQMFTEAYVRAFSPRSKEACLRQGIDPEELIYKYATKRFRGLCFFFTRHSMSC